MYDKCYFCLYQLLKLKKESTASLFVNFGRSRGTKEPTYITVLKLCNFITLHMVDTYPSICIFFLLCKFITLHMVDEAEVQLSRAISLLGKGCKDVVFINPEVEKDTKKVAAVK